MVLHQVQSLYQEQVLELMLVVILPIPGLLKQTDYIFHVIVVI